MDPSAQIAKLKNAGWAVVGLIPTTGSDGKIEASRVREDIRPKLERYQNEAADVLAPNHARTVGKIVCSQNGCSCRRRSHA